MLLHGRRGRDVDVSYSMPLASVSAAFLFGHAGLEGGRWAWAASTAVLYGLTAALGLLLGGWAAGAAAFALMLPISAELRLYPINAFYAIAVLLVAGALARRARAPGRGGDALLGLAVGLSLLHRSPLVLFPAVLAAFEAVPARGRRAALKRAVPALAVPILLLLPWIAMNWLLHGEFVPLERGRIGGLMLSAIGSVFKAQMAPSAGGGSAFAGWAGAAAREPFAYLSSCFARFEFILLLHPVLFLAAAAGLILGRRRAEIRAVGLLAAYFVAVHCGLAITDAYLVPLWPLLAVLAASAAPWMLGRAPAPEAGAAEPASRAVAAGLALSAFAGLFALGAAAVYPFRLASEPAPGAAPRADAWLLLHDGRRDLERGDVAAARESFARAAVLRPEESRVKFYLGWADTLLGRPESLLSIDPATFNVNVVHGRALPFLKAAAQLGAGRPADARAEIEAGLAIWDGLSRRPVGLLEELSEFLRSMPAKDRRRLLEAIAAAAPPDKIPDVRAELVLLADVRGDRARTYSDLAAMNPQDLRAKGAASSRGEPARRYPEDAERRRRDALAWQNRKEYGRAIEQFARLIRDYPAEASFYSDKALCEHLKGEDDAALADLAIAIRLEPKFLPAYLTAGALLAARGRTEEASRLYKEALSETESAPGDPLRVVVAAAREDLAGKTPRR